MHNVPRCRPSDPCAPLAHLRHGDEWYAHYYLIINPRLLGRASWRVMRVTSSRISPTKPPFVHLPPHASQAACRVGRTCLARPTGGGMGPDHLTGGSATSPAQGLATCSMARVSGGNERGIQHADCCRLCSIRICAAGSEARQPARFADGIAHHLGAKGRQDDPTLPLKVRTAPGRAGLTVAQFVPIYSAEARQGRRHE